MRSLLITSVSALAIALGGCSMFHSGKSSSANAANGSSAPQYSSPQTAEQQPPSYTEGSGGSVSPNQVKQVQQKLKQDGDYTGAVDGKLGPKTAQAVKQFQQQNGLQQTGSLDDQTLSKLGLEQTSGSGSSMPPQGTQQ